MENYFHKSNLERQKDFIRDTIKTAQKYPLDQKKFNDWYYGKESFPHEESEKIWLEFNRASIQVETITEYKFLLEELGHNKDWTISTLAHENAHANRGEQLGADHQGYTVTFIKKSNGTIEHQPAAIVEIPKNLDPEKYKHLVVEIARAPEDYEGENGFLSDGDIHTINAFSK